MRHLYRIGVALAAAGEPIETFTACTGLDRQPAERIWQWCLDKVDERRRRMPADITSMLAAVRSQPWHGQAGGSDVAVLEAVLALMWRYGKMPVAAAVGEVAVEAGVGTSTARRSLRRLTVDGWLVRNAAATDRLAAEYQPGPLLSTVTARRADPQRPAMWVLGSDAGRRGAAGKSALRVWQSVTDGADTTRAVAEQLGLATGTVRRHLATLTRLGLLRRHDGLLVAVDELDEAAWKAGTAGAGRRQREALTARRDVRFHRTAG